MMSLLQNFSGILLFCTIAWATPDYTCDLRRDSFVSFHGWRWEDIGRACEEFGSTNYPSGFCAVQVPMPTEHLKVNGLAIPPFCGRDAEAQDTWQQRFQAVSYLFEKTDSGTGEYEGFEFEEMIIKCHANAIKVYVDVEMNHMTSTSQLSGTGTAGSFYDGRDTEEFEAPRYTHDSVQYIRSHFHNREGTECTTVSGGIEDFNSADQIRNCKWEWHNDLKTSDNHVRTRLVGLLNKLITREVDGFRFAHARFVDPVDLEYIAANINVRRFIYQEVLDNSTTGSPIDKADYYDTGMVEEVRAGLVLTEIFKRDSPNGWVLANLTDWGNMNNNIFGLAPSNRAVVFIDDAASQRGYYSRNPGDVYTWREEPQYLASNVFMLLFPYGYPRVHSSYRWVPFEQGGRDVCADAGPPRNGSSDRVYDVVCRDENTNSDWNCEHNWLGIQNAVRARALLNADTFPVSNWWSNGRHQIAFGRINANTNLGMFLAINNEDFDLDANIYTGLPAGTYCDMMTAVGPNWVEGGGNQCTTGARTVVVDSDGFGEFFIPSGDQLPLVGIRTDAF